MGIQYRKIRCTKTEHKVSHKSVTNVLSCSISSANSRDRRKTSLSRLQKEFMVRLKNNWLLLFARRLVSLRMTASLQPQLTPMGRSRLDVLVGHSERECKLPAFHMGVAPAGTGLGGGLKPTPRPKFSTTSEEVVLIQWGG